jgi:hypothetical protein
MLAKIARSIPRRSFVLPKVTVADQTSFLSCRKATKARTFTSDRQPSGESWLKRLTGGKRVVRSCQVTLTGGEASMSTTDRRRCALCHSFSPIPAA